MKRRSGGVTVVLVPDEGGESRSVRLSPKGLRVALVLGGIGIAATLLMFTSWWFLAIRTARSWELETLVDSLREEQTRITALAENLSQIEEEYERIRLLFGSSDELIAPDLWLPPSGLPGGRSLSRGPGDEDGLPTSWPLTEPGYITQSMVEEPAGEHPGLDIAVPTDSYIRAAGAGRVVRVGEDPLYGNFVVLEHSEGYQTVYAHASSILAERGQLVRRDEVIALSGSSGRSTAPHLHFEIRLDGVAVDPLSMVEQPG